MSVETASNSQRSHVLGQSPLLSVADLVVSATNGRRIVDGISFSVQRGESVAIVGESGSGKTMTARALIGLLPRGLTARADVQFGDEVFTELSDRRLRPLRGNGISLLMQDPFTMLNPLTKVRTHLVETLRSQPGGTKMSRSALDQEVRRRLAEVGINQPDAVNRYPSELSGGMRQRVAIAAAIAKDPQLLIADEPTTALDATTQREVLQLVRGIQKDRGMSLLLITHDLRVAFAVCDRVLVMYAGSIVEVARPSELQDMTAHPYSRGLLDAEPRIERRKLVLRGIPGRVPKPDDVATRCVFSERCAFVQDTCLSARPALTPVSGDHLSACIRIDEIADELHGVEEVSAESTGQASGGTPLLVIESLVKHYGRKRNGQGEPALDEVSLSMPEGRSLGVVGESGSGKTTLARCLLGLEEATSGHIIVDGLDITHYDRLNSRDNKRARELVQCVFQDPFSSLNPSHTIQFILIEAARRRQGGDRLSNKELSAEVARLLNEVGLPATYAVRRPAALSGGERQRVAIARALAVRPRLLICDEPVAALDVSVQAQVLEVLRGVAQTGVNLLFITHDLAVARQITDDLVVLYHGRIVERGSTLQVLTNPQHDYTRRLLAAVPTGDTGWLT